MDDDNNSSFFRMFFNINKNNSNNTPNNRKNNNNNSVNNDFHFLNDQNYNFYNNHQYNNNSLNNSSDSNNSSSSSSDSSWNSWDSWNSWNNDTNNNNNNKTYIYYNSNQYFNNNENLENLVIEWIYNQVKIRVTKPYCENLKNGITLCKLVNSIKPNTIKKINTGTAVFSYRENLVNFVKGCESIGMTEDMSRFQDLIFEEKESIIFQQLYTLMKLSEKVLSTSPSGSTSSSSSSSSSSFLPSNSNNKPSPVVLKRVIQPQQSLSSPSSSTTQSSSPPQSQQPSSPIQERSHSESIAPKPILSALNSSSSQIFSNSNKFVSKSRIGFSTASLPVVEKKDQHEEEKEKEKEESIVQQPSLISTIHKKPPPPSLKRSSTANTSSNSLINNSNNNLNSIASSPEKSILKPSPSLNNNNNNNIPSSPPKSNVNHVEHEIIESKHEVNNNSNNVNNSQNDNSNNIKKPSPPALPPREGRGQLSNSTDEIQFEMEQASISEAQTATVYDEETNTNTYQSEEHISSRSNSANSSNGEALLPQQQQQAPSSPVTNLSSSHNAAIPSSIKSRLENNNSSTNNYHTISTSSPSNSNNSPASIISSSSTSSSSIFSPPSNNNNVSSPTQQPRDQSYYNTVSFSKDSKDRDNSRDGGSPNGQIKKPRSSTKQKLEKIFFSKTKSTTSTTNLNNIKNPSSPQSSPVLNSNNNNILSSTTNNLTSSTSSNKSSKSKKNINYQANSSPDLYNNSNNIGNNNNNSNNIYNNSNNEDHEPISSLSMSNNSNQLNSSGNHFEDDINNNNHSNNNSYSNLNSLIPDDQINSEELMKELGKVEFLFKDRKILKERVNFTYPEKFKYLAEYDELVQFENGNTFLTESLLSLPKSRQMEICRREERRFLNEIFTLTNVSTIIEENKNLTTRIEELQKMVESLMGEKKQLIGEKKLLSSHIDTLSAKAKNKSEARKLVDEGLIYNYNHGKLEIKGGETEKLIELLYNPEFVGSDYFETFLLTYRSFTSPKKIMDVLTKTYNDNYPVETNSTDVVKRLEIDQENRSRKEVHLKICNFLKRWCDKHFYDFDQDLVQEFNLFIQNCRNHQEFFQKVLNKISGIQLNVGGERQIASPIFNSSAPAVIAPKLPIQSIEDMDPVEIARQLTIIEFNLFKQIANKELLSLSWQKSDKEKRSPNLLKMIYRFNEVSNWVTSTIVKETTNIKKRASYLKRFIRVAEEFKRLNNFNGVFVIVSGLHSASVNRLKNTWSEISKQQVKQFEEFVALTSPNSSFAAYRLELRQSTGARIPYLGVHLSDLTFVEEGNQDKLENGYTNFFKCRLIAEQIKQIQEFQQQPYNLTVVEEMLPFLNHKILPESECFNLSLICEPRVTESQSQ